MKNTGPVRQGFTYNAPPTIARFMQSDSFGRLLCGPVGSGKTTGCLVETARRMGQQSPGNDGRRYTRWAIIRQTLKDAKATVLKDARGWFGALADWRVSESTLFIDYGDVYSEWMFVPLEDPDDLKRLLSTQLTGAYINESSEIDLSLLSDIAGRVGRFPNNEFGRCTWSGIFADTNMPIVGTPWADFIVKGEHGDTPEWQIFRQPGGRSPDAENLPHLNQTAQTADLDESDPIRIEQGRGYYRRLVSVGTSDYIRRFVDAEFGRDPGGTAVFAESFRVDFHVVPALEPVPSRMIMVGQDFGRNPWSLLCQLDHKGRLMVLEEVKGEGPTGENIGLEQHVRQNLIPVLSSDRYRGRNIGVVGDPAGQARDSLFEINCFDLLKSMGLPAERAPTNDIDPRIRSVESFLVRQVDGGGAILIDQNRCPTLIQGLNGQYRYSLTTLDEPRPVPDKNRWSHICDALQYVCLVAGNIQAYQYVLGRVMSQTQRAVRAPRPKMSAAAWT
jgi:hypothetical protein